MPHPEILCPFLTDGPTPRQVRCALQSLRKEPRIIRISEPLLTVRSVWIFPFEPECTREKLWGFEHATELVVAPREGDWAFDIRAIECSFKVPRGMGTIQKEGEGVPAIAEQIEAALTEVGWGEAVWLTPDFGCVEMSCSLNFYEDESRHERMERLLNARPLLDHLAASGFDVMPEVELLFEEKVCLPG